MNCKDLMIGDLVAEKKWEKYPLIIAQIRDGLVYAEYIDAEGKLHTFTEDLIAPIPLTEEILKANGRLYNGGWQRYLLHDNMNVSYDLDRYRFEYKYSRIENIHYVHELQHALRLAGLNDLADNFKI